ncbi:hypothetical protein BDD12DRAFT_830473, partial [Trichophaea hybrida]
MKINVATASQTHSNTRSTKFSSHYRRFKKIRQSSTHIPSQLTNSLPHTRARRIDRQLISMQKLRVQTNRNSAVTRPRPPDELYQTSLTFCYDLIHTEHQHLATACHNKPPDVQTSRSYGIRTKVSTYIRLDDQDAICAWFLNLRTLEISH